MSEAALENRNRWLAAAVGGVAVSAAVLMLFRFPAPVHPLPNSVAGSPPKAAVQVTRPDDSDLLLRAEAQLRDLRPLFLPTDRNAALPEPRLEPGRTFLDSSTLRVTFTGADAQISKELPPVAMIDTSAVEKATAADALSPRESPLALHGFGRTETRTTPIAPRGGFIEVVDMRNGAKVVAEPLPLEARPRSDKAWVPLELVALVDAAGLVSPLVVADGSGVDEVDAHFRRFLARDFRIGERLSPGFYRVIVAP